MEHSATNAIGRIATSARTRLQKLALWPNREINPESRLRLFERNRTSRIPDAAHSLARRRTRNDQDWVCDVVQEA